MMLQLEAVRLLAVLILVLLLWLALILLLLRSPVAAFGALRGRLDRTGLGCLGNRDGEWSEKRKSESQKYYNSAHG